MCRLFFRQGNENKIKKTRTPRGCVVKQFYLPSLKRIMTENYERCVIANDFHYPYQDDKVIKLWFKFLEDFKPDTVIINGDLLDCWALSKFDKNPKEGRKFKEEVDMGESFFQELRLTLPKAHLVYIFGNHEYRLQKYIVQQAPELIWFEGLSLQDLMHLHKYDVEVVNSGLKESFYQYGDLFVGHYNKVSKHGGYTVKNLIDDYGVSLLQAHTHRFGLHIRKTLDNRWIGGYENGCMCNLSPSYMLSPNWCHGFSVVFKEKNDGRFQVVQVPIIKGKFFFGTKEFKV